eukprot:494823_1
MASFSIRNKYIYLAALVSAMLIFLINIFFNIKSTQHTFTYVAEIINNPLQNNISFYKPSNTNTSHTNHIITQINNKLKHHTNNNTCNLLFCDKYKFDLMIQYYTSMSSITYPSSWIELNDQLFCPIKYSSLYNSPHQISIAGERLLKYIYLNQFKSNCNDPNLKYMFYDTSGWFSGLGATTNGGIIKYFTRALMSNRTFIMVGGWDWANTKHCQDLVKQGLDRFGFRCYFLPNSNCKYNNIIKNIDMNDETQYLKLTGVPKHCSIGDFPDKPWCSERILYIRQHGAGWYPKNQDIDAWINNIAVNYFSSNHNLLFANFQQYKAIIVGFAYRLQPNVRDIIYNKIRNAFIKSFNNLNELNTKFDPFRTIGFPIRASDKCAGNIMKLHGEMDCWSPEELNKLLFAIHYLKPSINSVIFTSEDMHYIDKLLIEMEKTEHIDGFKWNIIINHDDIKPAIGSAKFRTANYDHVDVDNTSDSDFEHDVIVGALSSLLLQTSNAKYIVHTKSSSWLDNLWNIGAQLNCESIFYSEQLEIKGFGSDLLHNMPAFLHDNGKRYHYFNKFCFELKQHGLLNKKVKWKHVLFPPDIWEQIHVLGLDEKRFKEKFGIDIAQNGWDNFCIRYTKPPFEMNDDVGV